MIHIFKKIDNNYVLDVGSGSIHLVDETAYQILEAASEQELRSGELAPGTLEVLRDIPAQARTEAMSELQQLINNGSLYSDDAYGEFRESLGLAPVKAMCLHVAHDCNLRCRYCFASTGGFGGQRMLMSFETAKAAIDRLIALSEGRRNLEVDFFGGEPLMNLDVVKETVKYARSIEASNGKRFRFTLTTNGYALDRDSIEFINNEMDNIVLSLDGRKEVNDQMRLCLDGGSSYDRIVPLYQELVAARGPKEYYVRGTYTRDNTDFDRDVLHLAELGFSQISVEPVVGPEEDAYSIREEDLPAIAKSYDRLLDTMLEQHNKNQIKFNFFHFMLDLQNGPCAIKRLRGCGCGNEYVAVTPEGDLYPCHQFVGEEQFRMGNVKTGIEALELKERFAESHLLNKAECQKCWAKFYCSGGCNANNYALSRSILKPFHITCELERIRLECAIALQVEKIRGNT